MRQKKRRLILLPCLIVVGLCLCYFLGGYAAALIVNDAMFGGRLSSAEPERSFATVLYNRREDYPLLKKRQEVNFASGGNLLRGYFYEVKKAKGTFVCVHGIKGSSDDETAMVQNALVEAGYSVFSFDLTSSGRSEGEGIYSLAQGAHDVKEAINYLYNGMDFYADLENLYLMGYSWGAYSVSASLNFELPCPVKGVLCFSGFVSPKEAMLATARSYVGFFADMNSLTLDWGLATKSGEDRHLSGKEGILSSGVRAYLVQGDEDDVVPSSSSLYEAFDSSAKVKKKLRKGFGHIRPWVSESSAKISKTLQKRADSVGLDEFEASLSEEEKASANVFDESLLEEALSFLTGETNG